MGKHSTAVAAADSGWSPPHKLSINMRNLLFKIHFLDSEHDGDGTFSSGNRVGMLVPRAMAKSLSILGSGWRDRLPIPRLDETTLIHRMFGGYFRSQVRCTKCSYKSNTYDPFLDLALEISKHTSNSLYSALADFSRKETLDEANRWKCDGCKRHVCATKQLTIFRPPLSLCIHLKRFSYSGATHGGKGSVGWQQSIHRGYGFAGYHGGSGKILQQIE
ncbi:MAG: hypothetical protein ACREOZ_01420, partial [Gloeomargaritales cyanobacterium]